MKNKQNYTGLEIAIVGMACRFPDAKNWREYWNNLINEKESITALSKEELKELAVDEDIINHPNFINVKTSLKDKDSFDSHFFGYRHQEAKIMNPVHRIFHECVWEALEDASCNPESYNSIGLFAGSGMDLNWNVYANLINEEFDILTLKYLSSNDYLASLLSYKLNLKGPAISVNTACSTSLVAINLACKSLLLGENNIALAGGASIITSIQKGRFFEEGMVDSSDGHCRAFDKDASGTTTGEGAGVVVLKRLSDAIANGDHIYSIIKGGAINNDGNNKVGFTAPSIEGQADCIRKAMKFARVEPESISYIETHGTGTRLGDSIEIEALNMAFNKNHFHKCAIGSVKTNMGHLNNAAGVAGLMKAALALKYKKIPASLNFKEPNPEVNFEGGPFYVNTKLTDWERNSESPLRAGVSSFGIGGTNAHIILEEPPFVENESKEKEYNLFSISVKTNSAMFNYLEKLKKFLVAEDVNLSDMCYSLQKGRKNFDLRLSFPFTNKADLSAKLDRIIKSKTDITKVHPVKKIVFLFSGQGTQYINAAKNLYNSDVTFKKYMDLGFDLLAEETGKSFKDILYPLSVEPSFDINQTNYAQPIIFLIEYSLAKTIMSYGVLPTSMIGHSIGEYTAACISGILNFEDALRLVVKRGELMYSLEKGSMLSVALNESQAHAYLSSNISLAAINSPEQIVFSGDILSIDQLSQELTEKKIPNIKLNTSHAFHSYMQEGILKDFYNAFEGIDFNKIEIPYISNLTGNYISQEEASSKEYWTNHVISTVQFSKGLENLSKNHNIFIEIGIGNSLSNLVKGQLDDKNVINLIKPQKLTANDDEYFITKIGNLWELGVDINWTNYYQSQERKSISLPTYSFDHIKYPAEIDIFQNENFQTMISAETNGSLSDWIYYPIWKQSVNTTSVSNAEKRVYLFFSTKNEGSNYIKSTISDNKNNQLIEVEIGESFKKESDTHYIVDPYEIDHFERLINELRDHNIFITDVIYSWGMNFGNEDNEQNLYFNFFGPAKIFQTLIKLECISNLRIVILTDSLHNVIGNEQLKYNQAFILGLVNILPQEQEVVCYNIDINSENSKKRDYESVIKEIRCIDVENRHKIIAIRNGQSWIQDFQKNKKSVDSKSNYIKENGIYLITGGLGNVGFVLAKYLIQNYNSRVILIGRKNITELHDDNKKAIKRMELLKSMSDKVQYINSDVSNLELFRNDVEEVEHRYGRIQGIFHTSAVLDHEKYELIQDITEKNALSIFDPKVKGVQNIYEIFNTKELDFALFVSSISSILGGLSYGSYSAANLFMEHFIESKSCELTNWKCIGLGEINFNDKEPDQYLNREYIVPDEINKLFDWSLDLEDIPIVFETTRDLNDRINTTYNHKKQEEESKADMAEYGSKNVISIDMLEEVGTEKLLTSLAEDFFEIININLEDNFFELGGNSLNALQFLNKIRKELNVSIGLSYIFDSKNFKELAEKIENSFELKEEQETIPIAPTALSYAISRNQRRIWIESQSGEGNLAYILGMDFKILGELNLEKLENAFAKLLERHQILRTIFIVENGEPRQKILSFNNPVKFYKLDKEDNIHNSLINEANVPMDLTVGPLIRAAVFQASDSEYYFQLRAHHIICDGWSFTLLFNELIQLYLDNETIFPEVKLQYKDYAEWQNKLIHNGKLNKSKMFWIEKLGGTIPVSTIPTDFSRSGFKTYDGNSILFDVNNTLTDAITRTALNTSTTQYIVMLMSLKILINYYTQNEDIVIGTDFSGRVNEETEKMLGMFINVMALRSKPVKAKKVYDYLSEIRQLFLDATEYQQYQFDDIVSDVITDRDMARNPFFDVIFVMQNFDKKIKTADLTGIQIEQFPISSEESRSPFDISFIIVENYENMNLRIRYNSSLYKEKSIKTLGDQYLFVLQQITDNTDQTLNEIYNLLDSFTKDLSKNNLKTMKSKNLEGLKKFKNISINNED